MNKFSLFFSLAFLSFFVPSFAQSYEDDFVDKTEAPYFKASTSSGVSVELPLKSTSAKANIAGNIADVVIIQTYINNTDSVIEADYVFPGSSQSAVYGLQMKIEDRTIIAKVKEKSEAKEEYETAKSEGKTAALLEQNRPNVFQMHVGNILPKDKIVVTISYTETIVPTKGVYEFVYPTVVSSRYVRNEDQGQDNWTTNPFAQGNNEKVNLPEQQFDIAVSLNSPTPISRLNSLSHKTKIDFKDTHKAFVKLDNGSRTEEKDFIIQYELTSEKVESGLLLYDNGDEKFFMLTAQPPKRVLPSEIPAREYIFIIDVSGSMNGFPIDISKSLMKELLSDLRPIDRFNLILFANGREQVFRSPVSCTEENIDRAISMIDEQNGSGGTDLLPALEEALHMSSNTDISKSVVILTDGLISVEKEAFDLIRTQCNHANFFAFGIGGSMNRYLMEGLAHIGNTEPIIVTSQHQAERKADEFREMILSPVLTNIKVDFDGFNTYDIQPSSYSDLFVEKPLVIFGKYKGEVKGKIKISGTGGNKKYKEVVDVKNVSPYSENQALKYLWARKKIQLLSDYNTLAGEDELQEEITALGIKYSLLTKFTSFVGVDSEVRTASNVEVSSGGNGSVPEPHEWALIVLCLILIGVGYYKWKVGQLFNS